MEQRLCEYISSIGNSKGLIFVGANTGSEIPMLKPYCEKLYIFEPISSPSVWNKLLEHADEKTSIYNLAISDFDGEIEIYPSSNNFESSSTLKPTKHLSEFSYVTFSDPIKVKCNRLDSFDFFTSCDCLFMDVQGAELKVLNGIQDFANLKLVYCEYTSFEGLYKDQCLFKDLNAKLEKHGFHFCETQGVYHNAASKTVHGNAIWRKL